MSQKLRYKVHVRQCLKEAALTDFHSTTFHRTYPKTASVAAGSRKTPAAIVEKKTWTRRGDDFYSELKEHENRETRTNYEYTRKSQDLRRLKPEMILGLQASWTKQLHNSCVCGKLLRVKNASR